MPQRRRLTAAPCPLDAALAHRGPAVYCGAQSPDVRVRRANPGRLQEQPADDR
jgi:hypothetical protein